MDPLANLNPQQQAAVTCTEGPLLIIAGPGSGKTRVITHRIAYLLQAMGVSPWSILAVTFTNKAAREMRDRLGSLVPEQTNMLTIGTFHSVCSRILRRDGAVIGIDSRFVIFDDADQIALVKNVLKDLNLDEKQYAPRALLAQVSKAKSELRSVDEYTSQAARYWEEVVSRVYRGYQERLAQQRALDFDDLILETVRLLRTSEAIRQKYQSRYRYILVDEFQDTNTAQYVLLRLLTGPERNLCVVGDEDQSVYSWRQADVRNILGFESDFAGATTVKLEQNYRSTGVILEAAASVIAGNRHRKPKRLWTENARGRPIVVYQADHDRDEATFVASTIARLRAKFGVSLDEIAVMYRTNAQSRVFEEALLQFSIPYRLVGATRFYDRREIKDLLAFLRFAYNPYDSVSLLRVVAAIGHGIGAKTVAALETIAARHDLPLFGAMLLAAGDQAALAQLLHRDEASFGAANNVAGLTTRARTLVSLLVRNLTLLLSEAARLNVVQLINYVLQDLGYGELLEDGTDQSIARLENVRELGNVATELGGAAGLEGLANFLENVALVSDQDALISESKSVTLITLHAAKGLEYRVVFLAGVEEGLCPHSRSIDDPDQLEEERRLFYVGMTRARELLYLTHAFRRSRYGESGISLPSRFLDDIPKRLLELRTTADQLTRSRAVTGRATTLDRESAVSSGAEATTTPETFRAGQKVRHQIFGEGIVVSVQVRGADQEVSVAFQTAGLKRLMQSFAKLEAI